MNTIHFYDKQHQTIMSFSKFNYQINEPDFHNFILFQIDVNYSFFQASINTECLDIDLKNFLIALQKLYNLEIEKISFIQTIEKNIEMHFKLTKFGHIEILTQLRNHIDKSILQFEYEIDQSFLPELIEEIQTVITHVKDN